MSCLSEWYCFSFLTITAGAASNGSSSSSRCSIPRDPSILILPTDNFGENEVRELVSLGFTREQVRVLASSRVVIQFRNKDQMGLCLGNLHCACIKGMTQVQLDFYNASGLRLSTGASKY